MKKTTREWVSKAEADYRIAGKLAVDEEPFHDAVAFHCQQCAEKYLKGLLEELGTSVPWTHDLTRLLAEVLTAHPRLRSLSRGASFLSQFASDTRYPGARTSKRQASAALRWTGNTRRAVRRLLDLDE